MEKASITTNSPEETMAVAVNFARLLKGGDIIFLEGDLGAGKTVFTKGLAKAFGFDPQNVVSPTFVLMNLYEGRLPLYHFDLYRLEKPQELKTVQFDEYFYGDGVSIIEWPKRLGQDAPKDFWLIDIKHKDETTREICISYPSKPQLKVSL